MSTLFSLLFLRASAERAVKSFAQGIAATFIVGDGFNAFHADWGNALGFGLGAAVLSLVTSVISAGVGPTGTPSLVDEVGRHAAR